MFFGYAVMNQPPDSDEATALSATRELDQLQTELEEKRVALTQLLHDVVDAETHRIDSRPGQLLEANERLVLAALSAQAEADNVGRALTEVSRSASLDPLTQLPNRVLLRDRFERAIAAAKRHRNRVALLFLDLDDFKQINDTLGHAVGDEVLKQVAHCLVSSVREADTVSRHGGDEFLILLTDVSHVSDAVHVANKAIAALGALSRVGDHVLPLTASIGISIYPDDGEDPDELMERADAAMYSAKRDGLGSFAFHGAESPSEQNREASGLGSLERHLTHCESALDEHDLRHANLRAANEQLVLNALSARDLKSATDQTQRKHTELLAALALEMHNRLGPIRTAAAKLGRDHADVRMLSDVGVDIEWQVANMSRLVSDLLDLSGVSAGRVR